MFLALVFVAIGILLIWRIGTWKTMTPVALVLFVLVGITAPEQPTDTTAVAANAVTITTPQVTTTTDPTSTPAPTVTEVTVTAEPVIEARVEYSTVYVPAPAPVETEAPAYVPPAAIAAVPTRQNSGFTYENCAAARAAGAAPVHAGEPGYGPHLDGDGDGIGCDN